MSSFLPPWLKSLPLVEAPHLELVPPHLNDNTGDLDRLIRALKQRGYAPVHVNPARINHWVRRLREGKYRVTAIIGYASCHWELLEVQPDPPEKRPILGFAVDLGTTSLAFYLVDLARREILAHTSVANPQIPIGEDILTRILYAREDESIRKLQSLLLESFNQVMGSMLGQMGYREDQVYALAVAGNTAMSH